MFRWLRSLAALICFTATLCAVPHLTAQAVRTASKSADISVFAGFEGAHPDYGPRNSYGAIFGADYTRYFHLPVAPSLEFRGNVHSNYAVAEHTYLVGLRAVVPLHFVRPYADFLVGPGTILFPLQTTYRSDDSVVYSFGGGIDVPVIRNFALNLDLQAQHWNTGEFTYTPSIASIGVRYTIPFRPHVRQRDLIR